jgi:hypothetical protein
MILQQGIENDSLAIGILPVGNWAPKGPSSPPSAFRIPFAKARDWFCIELSSRANHDGTVEDSAALKWKSGVKRLPWPYEVLVADAADLVASYSRPTIERIFRDHPNLTKKGTRWVKATQDLYKEATGGQEVSETWLRDRRNEFLQAIKSAR